MTRKTTAIRSTRSLLREGRSISVNKKGIGKAVNILILTATVLIFGALLYYGFLLSSVKPTNSLSSEAKNRLLITREGLNSTLIILEGKEKLKIEGAWYIVSNEKNATVVVYFIPPGVYMKDYLNKVSEYVSVGDLKYVGDTVSQPRTIEYAIWQLGNLTGITPDSYIWLNSDSLNAFSNMFGDVFEYKKGDYVSKYADGGVMTESSFAINSFLDKYSSTKLVSDYEQYQRFIGGIDTNMSLPLLFARIHNIEAVLEGNDKNMLDLGQIWATNMVSGVTGRNINLINYPEVDERLGEFVKELKGRDIEKEQVKIEVYNASEFEGLAGRYSRKFENAGIDVVRYENAPTSSEKTIVYVPKPEKFPSSLSLLKRLLVVEAHELTSRPDFMTTGDIIVILGKDLASEAQWK